MVLDRDNPYLERNLERLEKRFRQRFLGSIEKKKERENEGKKIHQTVLKFIEENRKRVLMAKLIKVIVLKLNYSIQKS